LKAIIPVAGAGTKLRPHTYTQPKPLIPVAGQPILGHIMDQLISAGITEFVFVIGYLGDKIRNYVSSAYPDVRADYVVQNERKGLGHAIWLTRHAVSSGEEVIIALGDTIIEADIGEFVHSPVSALAIRKVEDPRKFGVAEFDEDGFIRRVVEKPNIPKSNEAIVGWYKIREYDDLIEALNANIEKEYTTRDEIQLTDGIMMMIKGGARIRGFKVDNWYDCGQKEVLLEINAILLKKKFGAAEVNGFDGSIIVPPVFIGKNTLVRHSIIGPNITIGENAVIENSIIRDSIIGSYTRIRHTVMTHSIVGGDSLVAGSIQQLNIGDNTELDLTRKE
jgi:glucose-1-phosphate thymidylyltransferase